MTPEQFCYWLQGFLELAPYTELGPVTTQSIRDHLNTVFRKVTPEVQKTENEFTHKFWDTTQGRIC